MPSLPDKRIGPVTTRAPSAHNPGMTTTIIITFEDDTSFEHITTAVGKDALIEAIAEASRVSPSTGPDWIANIEVERDA